MKKLLLLLVGLLFWTGSSFGQNLSESFENEFLVPPDGWTVYYANQDPAVGNLVTHDNFWHHDGNLSFRFSSIVKSPPYGQYLVTPQLNVTEGDQTISFYYSKYQYGIEWFRVGWSSTGNTIADFTEWSPETCYEYGSGFIKYEKNDLPVGTKYVAIHYTSGYEYLYIDEVQGPALFVSNDLPNCAINISPENSAINVPITAFLNWRSGGGEPTGYKLYFGTDGGGITTPVNLENGTVQTSPYAPIFSLNYSTTYYWQVVPFNTIGDATECPIWSFTTKEDPTISTFPHTENFDGLWTGTPEAPEGWTILNPDNDTYFWKQSFENINPTHSRPYAAQGSGNTNDYLITPLIDLVGTNAKIKWWDKVESAEYVNSYKVMVSSTPSDILSFTEIPNGTFNCANVEWTEHELDLIAYKGQKIYVAFYQFASPSPLWGFGIDDVTIEEIPSIPVFTATPESIRFGGVNLGESSVQTFTISNLGMEPFEITGIALGGIDVDQFVLTDLNSYPIALEYRDIITVEVTFNPTSDGEKIALLTISDNQGGGNHLVNISGNPLGATCTNPLPLTFPAYAIEGNTADYGNDYSSKDIGITYDTHANYMNGYDVVYQFTLENGGYLGGTIFSKSYHIGAFIFQDCPNPINPPVPVYYDVNQDLKMANFWYEDIPAGTYYLIITSWAESSSESTEYKVYLNFYENKPPDQSVFMETGLWSDLNSWSFGGPGKSSDAQPGYVTDVVIHGDITVDGDYACKNLTIGPNGSITFEEGSKLSIIKLPTIESDDTGTGSFIANDDNYIIGENSDYENEVKIQRYLTGGWEGDNTGWHQISSPVKDQDIDAFHSYSGEYDFYAWGESENLWLNYFDQGWTGGENFNLGQGYLISYPDDENWKEFEGKLHNASVTKTNLSKSAESYSGWHLLGNPFASALKWNDGNWALNNVAGNAKIWHESNKSYSDIAADGIIPSAQGFMVQVGSGTNSITIPADSRVHSATDFYKSGNQQLLLVAAETEGGSAQESKIMVNPMATEGFDFEYDSRFLAGYAPIFYSLSGEELLSTNSLPELNGGKVIPFGFVKNAASSFTIELKESIAGRIVYLTDNKIGTITNLTQSPVYSFTSGDGDDANRFSLTFGTLGINNPEANDDAQVYAYDGILYVETSAKEAALVNVYNLTGQLVMQGKTGGNMLSTFNASALTNGVYVVNVILNQSVVSRKVVIRK